jgi:glycosyltransferase involved in cell wall biosynthesis
VPYAELQAHLGGADLGLVAYANTCRNNYYCAPTKLHEYAMAGVPVVAVDFPPVRDILSQYDYGRCFEPDNAEDLRQKIQECLDSVDRHEHMKVEARRAAREVNWEHEGARLIEIFRALESRP